MNTKMNTKTYYYEIMHTWHLENPTLQLERISQRYAGLTGHKGPSRSSLCERFNGKSYSENKKKYAKTPRGILGHKMSDFKSKKTSSHVWKQSKLVNEPRQLIRQKLKEFKNNTYGSEDEDSEGSIDEDQGALIVKMLGTMLAKKKNMTECL